MAASMFRPSAWAQSWLRDSLTPTQTLARDPIMGMQDKLWVLRQRAGVKRSTAAVWSAEHHAKLGQR